MSETLSEPTPTAAPAGIGGWLLLPVLHLVLNVGSMVWGLATFILELRNGDAPLPAHPPPPLAFLYLPWMAFAAGVCLYAVFVLARLFKKKKNVPSLMEIFYVLVAIEATIFLALIWFVPVPLTLEKTVPDALRHFFRSVLGAIIWIAYFRNSLRVRNTFVN